MKTGQNQRVKSRRNCDSLLYAHRKGECPWLIHYKSKMLHQNTFIFILYMFDGAPTLLSKIMNNGPVVYACTYPPPLPNCDRLSVCIKPEISVNTVFFCV